MVYLVVGSRGVGSGGMAEEDEGFGGVARSCEDVVKPTMSETTLR